MPSPGANLTDQFIELPFRLTKLFFGHALFRLGPEFEERLDQRIHCGSRFWNGVRHEGTYILPHWRTQIDTHKVVGAWRASFSKVSRKESLVAPCFLSSTITCPQRNTPSLGKPIVFAGTLIIPI
jgi:hypothetical protein